MLRIVRNSARCPQRRVQRWMQKKRERSLLKLMRHLQACAASWMQAICQSECALYRFLPRLCATAERLAAKAARKRRTTAQILREHVCPQHEAAALAEVVNA
jgi:hypothetical protein